METINMVDVTGHELKPGDLIFYTNSNYIAVGMVWMTTPRTLTYFHRQLLTDTARLRSPDHVLYISDNMVAEILKNGDDPSAHFQVNFTAERVREYITFRQELIDDGQL